MGRLEKRLSAVVLKRLGPGVHGDGLNLWFQVTPAGNRSWLLRYYRNGRARAMGLGPLHTVSLAEAREKALEVRKQLLADLDPLEEREKARTEARLNAAKAITFRTASERYIEAHRAGWKNAKHAEQWTASLASYAYPVLGNLPVAQIEVGHVMRVLEPVWSTRTETASRVRGRMEAVLDWASARGFRRGENPARWRGHLDKLLPARKRVQNVQHFAAMPFAAVPAYMATLAGTPGVSALALRFTVLCACRSSDTLGARWSEVDLATRTWSIPAARMKMPRQHTVPLSDAALQVLATVPRVHGTPYIFPGARDGRPLSSMAMLETLREKHRGLTVHGFRSAFRDWAAERTPHPAEVAEMALAHVVANKVEAAYRRGDLLEKRRALMRDWAAFCEGG